MLTAGSAAFAQSARIRVTVRDSATNGPGAATIVELSAEGLQRSTRADEIGNAVFAGLKPMLYAISVLRIGYRSRVVSVPLGLADTTITILLEPLPNEIAKFQVNAKTQEIFGIVGAMPGPHAVVGAKVQLSTSSPTRTDSAGKFIFRNLKPGKYTLRIVAPGFADRIQMIDLPIGTAYESSHLLDAGKGGSPRTAFVWAGMEQRVRWRKFSSAVVNAEELRRFGDVGLANALARTQEVAAKGLDTRREPCVYINGQSAPNFPLDGISLGEVAFVEVYPGDVGSRASASRRATGICGPTQVYVWTNR